MNIKLEYQNNIITLDLNDVGAIFADDVLEGDRLGQFQIISKEVQIKKEDK